MSSLTQRYRPQTLRDMAGNLPARKQIASYAKQDSKTRPHTYLISGPVGTGKTTLARIAARLFGAKPEDVFEYNNAQFRGIDAARDIIESLVYGPSVGSKAKVYILDEVHSLTHAAQESLLKAIEEPPSYVYFFLCTTDPQKLLATTRSRCTHIQLKVVGDSDMVKLLSHIAKEEKKEIPATVIQKIVSLSDGSPRMGVTMLEQALTSDDPENLEFVADEVEADVIALCRALFAKRVDKAAISEILASWRKNGIDPETIRRMVLGYAQSVYINSKLNEPKAHAVLTAFKEPTYNSGFVAITTAVADVLYITS